MEINKATLVWCYFRGIVSRDAVVWSHGGSVVFLSGVYTSCRSEGGDREDHVDDLVLGLGRDLFGLLGGLGGLCAHVGTLGESAELWDE